jgi:hypothetical protein
MTLFGNVPVTMYRDGTNEGQASGKCEAISWVRLMIYPREGGADIRNDIFLE